MKSILPYLGSVTTTAIATAGILVGVFKLNIEKEILLVVKPLLELKQDKDISKIEMSNIADHLSKQDEKLDLILNHLLNNK